MDGYAQVLDLPSDIADQLVAFVAARNVLPAAGDTIGKSYYPVSTTTATRTGRRRAHFRGAGHMERALKH